MASLQNEQFYMCLCLHWGNQNPKMQYSKTEIMPLAQQITTTHRDESKRLCVYNNALDLDWSGTLTPVPLADLERSYVHQ